MHAESTHVSPSPSTPLDLLRRISDAHGATDAAIIRRIRAVKAGLDAGFTVKALAADLKVAAAQPGSGLTPVGQSTLGYATAVLSALDKAGMTLSAALASDTYTDADGKSRSRVADAYRAVMRHGAKTAVARLSAAAIDAGSEPADKVAGIGEEAARLIDEARETRRDGTKRAPDAAPATVTITEWPAILARMAHEIATGAHVPTAEDAAALAALVAEVQRASKRAPLKPAKVIAPVAA